MSPHLNSYFTGSPELRDLTHRARQLAALQAAYRKAIPPTLAHASRVIGFEQQRLTVGADNSAVAAKLRHLAPQILQQLQGDRVEVNGIPTKVQGILVKVQVSYPAAARTRDARALHETGRRQIANLAATMADSPLKRALLRLINR